MKRWSNGKYWIVVAANATPARRSAAYDWCDGVMAGPAVTLVKAGR
jgi:hypothetical protein